MLRLAAGAVCAVPNLAWYGNSNAQERRKQQVDTAHPTVESIYARHCPKKAASAIKDLHKPGHASSRCLKSDITEFTASDRSQTVPNSIGCWGGTEIPACKIGLGSHLWDRICQLRPGWSTTAPAAGSKFNLLPSVEVPMRTRSAASPGLGATFSGGFQEHSHNFVRLKGCRTIS